MRNYVSEQKKKTAILILDGLELMEHPTNHNLWSWPGIDWISTDEVERMAKSHGLKLIRSER